MDAKSKLFDTFEQTLSKLVISLLSVCLFVQSYTSKKVVRGGGEKKSRELPHKGLNKGQILKGLLLSEKDKMRDKWPTLHFVERYVDLTVFTSYAGLLHTGCAGI